MCVSGITVETARLLSVHPMNSCHTFASIAFLFLAKSEPITMYFCKIFDDHLIFVGDLLFLLVLVVVEGSLENHVIVDGWFVADD
jgi:hypothetical protein